MEDSEADSGMDFEVGFENVDFSLVFLCFWLQQGRRHRSGTDPAQIRHSRRTPQGRIQESFFPLEEPYSETLLGKYQSVLVSNFYGC